MTGRRTTMGRIVRLLMLLLLAAATLASAADVRPSDQVRFIERDQHIPAHPAPGDTRVHLRLVSGSEATVLQVNSATGWMEMQGEPLQGTENTGFAFKRGLTIVRQPDFEALDIRGDGGLRYGTRIDLTHNGQTLQLMSVHLKSGCFDNATTSSACATLLAQVPVLEGWIDEAAQGPRPFIVLGDFNHRFNVPNDQVWADLDDGEPANADLTTLTQDMPISRRDNTFPEFIDHLVVDRRVLPWVDRSSFRHITYCQA